MSDESKKKIKQVNIVEVRDGQAWFVYDGRYLAVDAEAFTGQGAEVGQWAFVTLGDDGLLQVRDYPDLERGYVDVVESGPERGRRWLTVKERRSRLAVVPPKEGSLTR